MGLPYWTAPAPIDTKAAIKADVTAAQRSPIRRRHSPARLHPSAARRVGNIRDEGIVNASGRPASGQGMRSSTRRGPYSSRTVEDLNMPDQGWPIPPPPRVPVSWDYPRASRTLSRGPGYASMSGFERDHSGFLLPRDISRDGRSSYNAPEDAPRHRALRPLSVDGQNQTLLPEHDVQHLVSVRRMGRRNVADGPLPASSLRESWEPSSSGSTPNPTNGLGDRERSISPAVDDTTDAWDTMLTTITPDAQLPSFDSSSTSAAASASASFSAARSSNNNSQSRSGSDTRSSSASAASFRTHLTIPSPMHIAEHECTTDNEHSFDSGSDTEDEADILATSEHMAHTRHPRSPPARRPHARTIAEMRETLRERPWRTSAVRDEPAYQAEAELALLAHRNNEARLRRTPTPEELDNGFMMHLQQQSRELDRQMYELRADIDRASARLGDMPSLPPHNWHRRLDAAAVAHPAHSTSRYPSHFESFRAARDARDAARRTLRAETERRVEAENLLAESRASAGAGTSSSYDDADLSSSSNNNRSRSGSSGSNPHNDGRSISPALIGTASQARDTADTPSIVRDDPTLARDGMLGNDSELEGMRAILERMSRRDDVNDPELQGLRAILDRMSRRDDNPDGWESVGLSTAIPRGRL